MEKQNGDRPLRVFLWMVPRSNSTVFMKCLSFVDDAEVWMEPYCACYINGTLRNPDWGKGNPLMDRARAEFEEIENKTEYAALKKLEIERANKYKNVWPQETFSYPWLKKQLEIDTKDKKYVFIKDESFAIKDQVEYLPDVPTRHTFLIRHPQEVYTSFKNVCVNAADFVQFSWEDYHIGDNVPYMPVKDFFKEHFDNWKYVKENLDSDPVVIDGFDLANQPEVILPKLFEKLGVPYKESYLQWSGDPELVYSTWKGSSQIVILASKTKATCRAVESTRFEPSKYPRGTSRPEWKITDELKEYIEGAMPYYKKMYENRLT